MSEEIEISGIKVPKADWDATPPSIQALVLVLSDRLRQQDERIQQLEERLNQTSKNSSKPPSSDGFGQPSGKPKKSKNRRTQHRSKPTPRQARKLRPSEECDAVKDVLPSVCADCGAPFYSGEESAGDTPHQTPCSLPQSTIPAR